MLARMGLRVSYNRDGSVHISQPPGAANALGRIRFNFPNRFLVYQHDTPDKHLFAHDVRAYSHGCMRVQDPAKYAEVMLGMARPDDGYTAERIKRMYGYGREPTSSSRRRSRSISPIRAPSWMTTASCSSARDIYGLDSRMIAALKSERGVVEPQQERAKEVAPAARRARRRAAAQRHCRSSRSCSAAGEAIRPSPPRRVSR